MANSAIRGFVGEFRFLSNFYQHPFEWRGIVYPSSEHAFVAGKTTDKGLRREIALAPTSAAVKALGRKLELRPGWDEYVSVLTMREVLDAKFADPGLGKLLMTTTPHYLVETNMWHDQKWGDCACGRPACKSAGVNLLGICLMDLRDDLIHEARKSLSRRA